MSEEKKSLIDLVPDSIDNAVKNITDKPTQNMGTTLADIWYLVFGGVSQAAEKRKLKYSYALQEFENELKEKISKIPEDKLIEPDIQVVAPALESSKYCVEKDELRKMFTNLISASMNIDEIDNVYPIFSSIIQHMTTYDAKLLKKLYDQQHSIQIHIDEGKILASLTSLECQGLIYTNIREDLQGFRNMKKNSIIRDLSEIETLTLLIKDDDSKMIKINLTDLGFAFCKICIN